jgi:hypothetical protein
MSNIINNNIIINELKPEIKKYNRTKNENLLDYKEYSKKNVSLNSYKIPDLKIIAKQHNLHVTGTKPILIDRIITHFKKTKNVILIQSIYRGWVTRLSMKLRGPAFKNRTLCVNDKDFITMEPLNEIPVYNFFSYEDDKHFKYGFDITSLIQSLKQNGKLENPYNRERISSSIINIIRKLYRLSFIVFADFKNENEKPTPVQNNRNRQINNNVRQPINNYNPEQQNRINRLHEHRLNNPLSQRITDLFLELDHLGNYTNANWFNLSTANYVRLYRHLYDIWFLRTQMSRETRYNICPLQTPFSGERNIILELDYVKNACVEVFENLVFTGSDDEHRRLGAFHALTALTIVSADARQAMPWLYESVTGW